MSMKSPRSNNLMIVALSALVGFAAVYFTLAGRDNAAPPKSPENIANATTAPENDDAMAAFVTRKTPETLPDIAFKDGNGNDVKLSDFKGRTVLLNLWATWCSPCREEMPSLDRLEKALGSDKFQVVALSLDRKGVDAAKKFLEEVKATSLKLYIDDTAKQGSALRLVGMPTTILIDKDGKEVGRLAGPAEWDSTGAKKLIEAAIH